MSEVRPRSFDISVLAVKEISAASFLPCALQHLTCERDYYEVRVKPTPETKEREPTP
jgi:hypothetical protein